jgi:hypothetical protein
MLLLRTYMHLSCIVPTPYIPPPPKKTVHFKNLIPVKKFAFEGSAGCAMTSHPLRTTRGFETR